MNRLFILGFALLSACGTAHAAGTSPVSSVPFVQKAVNSIGTSGQVRAGHVLAQSSFPAAIATDNTKLAYFNLAADANDELNNANHNLVNGTNASGCNAGGGVTYPGSNGILGTNGAALFVRASVHSLCSTNSFFKVTHTTDWAMGGWFTHVNWTTLGSQVTLFGVFDAPGRSFFVWTSGSSSIGATISADGLSTTNISCSAPISWEANSWHHVALRYNSTTDTAHVFLDGQPSCAIVQSVIYDSTGVPFRVGAYGTTPGSALDGKAEEFFVVNGALVTDEHIAKLASYRLDHAYNTKTQNQNWMATLYRGGATGPAVTIPENYFVIDKSLNSLWLNFWDASSTDQVQLRMRNSSL